MPGVAISVLAVHHMQQEQQRQLAGSSWEDTGFVSTTSRGTPHGSAYLICRFHAVLKLAELPQLRFHDLGHSAATLLLAHGVSPQYVSDLLEHSQVSFTMQTYAHLLPRSAKTSPR